VSRAALLLALSLGATAACASLQGARSFDLSYPATPAPALDAIAARVSSSREAATPAVAVLVAPRPAQGFTVFGLPSGERLGQVGAALVGRPVIAGDLVLARTAGSIVAWTLAGAERWRVPDHGYHLVGAAQDGGLVALTLGGFGLSRRNGVALVVDAQSGATHFERVAPIAFGAPCLVGDDLFLPWNGQHLSVFSVRSGDELARVHGRTDLIGFARREGPAVWYGARALLRFGASSADVASVPRASFTKEGVPGAPPFMADPYVTLNAGLDARERVRLAWRPDAAATGASFAGASVYSVFHRDVFGVDPASNEVRWGYVHNADLAGVEASREGLAAVDENGHFLFVDARTGQLRWRVDLHAAAAQAVLQVPAEFGPRGHVEEGARTPVEGLLQAAGGTDSRLLPAQLFAVRALIDHDVPEATHALVQVVTHRRYPQELRAAAAEAITRRSNGSEAMVEALAAHYDYVADVEAPPVGLLARGIAAHRERSAVPALIAHLQDPATAASDLPALVSALRELGDPACVQPLVDFIRLNHADIGAAPPVGGGDPIDDRIVSDQEPMEAALEQAVTAVAALGTLNDKRVLAEVAIHPRTPRAVSEAIARALRGEGPAAIPTEAPQTPMTFQAPPRRVAMDAVEASFFPVRQELLGCLRGAPSRPATVRITFRYDGAGAISNVIVNPATFQPCMEPIIDRVRLPESGANREMGTYNLSTLH
jgi:hypothetical protein